MSSVLNISSNVINLDVPVRQKIFIVYHVKIFIKISLKILKLLYTKKSADSDGPGWRILHRITLKSQICK